MSEWLKEHAWKSTLFARADAHEIPPTHSRSTTSRNIDTRRHVLVNHRVDRGFEGSCDTVLTQFERMLTSTHIDTHQVTSPDVTDVRAASSRYLRPIDASAFSGVMSPTRTSWCSGCRRTAAAIFRRTLTRGRRWIDATSSQPASLLLGA